MNRFLKIFFLLIVTQITCLRAQIAEDADPPLVTIDHFVSHVSTVPATTGDYVKLFVREKFRSLDANPQLPAVLMIHGATVSIAPAFDLQFENYSWMDFLANAGFDVFAMDFTGYGLSPRPMMDDPCNASAADQQAYLIPKTLSQPCSPSYAFNLTSVQSDWDEIDTVVNYILAHRQVDRVNLVAWSRGGPRAGGYAARHPGKIGRVVLYAPVYANRAAPDEPPDVLPQSGVPMTVLGDPNLPAADWPAQATCDNQVPPAIRGTIVPTMLKYDPMGSTWGAAGVRRAPVWNTSPSGTWGWNAKFAKQVTMPTLVIRGDTDITVPGSNVTSLFSDLGAANKVFVHVACASHYMIWESQHMALLRASVEWLRNGTFEGDTTGSFFVDTKQQIHKEAVSQAPQEPRR